MAYRGKIACHRRGWMIGLSLLGTVTPMWGDGAIGQIVPDGTLGNEPSIVAPTDNVRGLPGILIRGGARRGANLFQSFSDFNVGIGQRVYFANPAGVESILSRVTGLNPSRIMGTLGVDGAANLFLLNPRGILFGADARLDVAGSFVASTADRFDFGNGLSFSATHPEAPPLLAVSLRPGLQYGTNYQGDIVSAGQLAVGQGQTLTLSGKTVTLTGSLATPGGTVQVLGDRLLLRDRASIDVSSPTGGGNVFVGGDYQGQGSLPTASYTYIAPNVTINASGTGTTFAAPGGQVIVWADHTTRFYGTVNAQGATAGGDGGLVEISGKENLVFGGRVDASAPNGRPGTLLLDPTDIEIVAAGRGNGTLADVDDPNDPNRGANGTQIGVDLINNATAHVLLQATNNITFSAPIAMLFEGIGLTAIAGNSIFVNQNIATNRGGINLTAQTGDLALNGVTLDTNPTETGIAGPISLTAQNQLLITNSSLYARSNAPEPGFSQVKLLSTQGSVTLTNTFVSSTNFGSGFAGDIFIDAPQVIDLVNSRLFSRGEFGRILIGVSSSEELANRQTTPLPTTIAITNSVLNSENGRTNRGRVGVYAADQLFVNGSELISKSDNTDTDPGVFSVVELFARSGNASLRNSNLSTSNFGTGFSGDVVISAGGDLAIANTSIFSRGNQGRVLIGQANNFRSSYPAFSPRTISIDNSSINTDNGSVTGNAGVDIDAGGVSVRATRTVNVTNNSEISSNTRRRGDAGAVFVRAGDTINLDNSLIFSNVERRGIGDAGIVDVRARSLFVFNGAQIQTLVRQAGNGQPAGQGNAGDVIIVAPETVEIIGRNSEGFPSAVFSDVNAGAGLGGNVVVSSRAVKVRNGGKISVDNRGTGLAGNIVVVADAIWLDNRAFISAQSASGEGGNILLNTLALIMGRNSNISATAGIRGAGGDGGNIAIGRGEILPFTTINSAGRVVRGLVFDQRSLIVAGKTFRDNNILAEALTGTGGNIRINTGRLFDLAERSRDFLISNDISSSSSFGTNGTVLVDTFDIFPSLRTDPLPDRYEVANVSEGCDPRVRQETSRFVVTGRGGLPTDPTEVLSPDTIATPPAPSSSLPPPVIPTAGTAAPTINPARGWIKNSDGSVRLVAYATDRTIPDNPFSWSIPRSCYAP